MVILICMKTAISLPDELFTKVENKAKRLGVSRSRLFTIALTEYMQESDSEDITDRLNEIFNTQSSSLDTKVMEMQEVSIGNESW